MKRKYYLTVVIAMAAICGISLFLWFSQHRPQSEAHIPGANKLQRVLTIRGRDYHARIIRQAAAAMQADWEKRNMPYEFYAEIEYYGLGSLFDDNTRFQTGLMAGVAQDIFMFDPFLHCFHALINSGFLQDIYPLIDACPTTGRDSFYANALDAFAINGGLYILPTSFGINYVGVNVNLPEEFLSRFTQKYTVTLREMIEFYLDLKHYHGNEFGHFKIIAGCGHMTHHNRVLQTFFNDYVDFNTRTADLMNPGFMELLELLGRLGPQQFPYTLNWLIGGEDLQEWEQSFIFHTVGRGLGPFTALFEPVAPSFIHYIPLVDEQGRLLIDTPGEQGQVWSGICISTRADGALAWEFTTHLIYAFANPIPPHSISNYVAGYHFGVQSLASSILRSTFRESTMLNLANGFDEWGRRAWRRGINYGPVVSRHFPLFVGFDRRVTREEQFEAAINRIAAYNEYPMAMIRSMIPHRLFGDHLDQFLRGKINAETAAQRMQNAISLWLIE